MRLLFRRVNCGTLDTTDSTETTHQTPHQPKTGLFTVYQLSEVGDSLLLWVSTVFVSKYTWKMCRKHH